MKHKKLLLVSTIALLAILVSACAGAVTGTSTQTENSQAAPVVSDVALNTDNANQPASNVPAQNASVQGDRPGGPDLTAAAEALGVTVEELQAALLAAKPADCTTDPNTQPAQGTDCRPDLAAVATALGVTEDELKAALGGPDNGRQGGGDLTAAAEALGVTVEELQAALQAAKPADCTTDPNTQPAQGTDCRLDLAAVATDLGVTEEELQSALGNLKRGPDFAAAAETLGITEEELQAALLAAKPAECTTDQSGQPAQGTDCHPDLTAAAKSLGITAEELQAALGKPPQGGQGGPGNGGPGGGQQLPQGGQGGPNGGQQPPAPQP